MPSFSTLLLAVIGHVHTAAAVLAHQGGWDEFLMVAAPVGIFAALLFSANRRAARLQKNGDDGAGGTDPILGGSEQPRNERGGPT